MSSSNLDNLIKTGQLKPEPVDMSELLGLFASGNTRLKDANNIKLAKESRFDLAYNAAHALALAALRMKNYRPDNRYLVFQLLPLTTGLGPEVWRVLATCHQKRNLAEYEGFLEVDNQLLEDLLNATNILLESVTLLKTHL